MVHMLCDPNVRNVSKLHRDVPVSGGHRPGIRTDGPVSMSKGQFTDLFWMSYYTRIEQNFRFFPMH